MTATLAMESHAIGKNQFTSFRVRRRDSWDGERRVSVINIYLVLKLQTNARDEVKAKH